MMTLTITQPDDWHIHLRDGNFLATTVAHAARQFQRVLVMPNLKPPVSSLNEAKQYYQAIMAAVPAGLSLQPLMTLYLMDRTTAYDIKEAKQSQLIYGCKLYPAGATTHSDSGVTLIEKLYPVFDQMQSNDLPLLIHGEVTDNAVDVFDREARFIEVCLAPLVKTFPNLRIVLEHITTEEAVHFIEASSSFIGATITAHHLLMNRNDLLVGGIKPHHYCLPILKRRKHQEALIKAATSGSAKYFLGTDSAPHTVESKQSSCGCAGIYTSHAAMEFYCEVFEQVGALDKLEKFASFNGADFYKLPRNKNTITLVKESWQVPEFYPFGNSKLIPFRAGQSIPWKLSTR